MGETSGPEPEPSPETDPEPQPEKWTGLTVGWRTFEIDNASCEDACGASVCVEAVDQDGTVWPCEQWIVGECTCADESPEIVAVSECSLNPNSGSVVPGLPMWASGSCEDYCGAFGFACLATVWGPMRTCPDVEADDWSIHYDGPTTRPDDVPGPDGVFRVLCWM